jgi:hypothetical protein
MISDSNVTPTSDWQASPFDVYEQFGPREECVMTRWMNREEVERSARVTDAKCAPSQFDTSKSVPEAERGDTVNISIPESWLDRIQVGFPRANWW